jgi:hypothetical protein
MRKRLVFFAGFGIILTVLYFYNYEIVLFVKSRLRDQINIQSSLGSDNRLNLSLKTEYDEGFKTVVETKTVKFSRVYGKNKFFVTIGDSIYQLDVSYFKSVDWSKCEIDLGFETMKDSIFLYWRRVYADDDVRGIQRFPNSTR